MSTSSAPKAKKNFPALRKISYFFGSTVVLALFLCYYLFIFVAKKEKEMIERNFRVLNKIGENLQQKLNDHNKMATQIFKDASLGKDGFEIIKNINAPKSDSIIIDSKFPSKVKFYKKNVNKRIEIELAKLFSSLGRNYVFSHHIIADTFRRIIYTDDGLLNPLSRLDTSIGKRISRFNSKKRAEIGGKEYYIFTHPFVLNSNAYIVTGLVSEEEYFKEKATVPESFLLLIFITAFIILIFFPFIKSALIRPQETLNSIDILASSQSLFMIFCVFTFILFHFYGSKSELGHKHNDVLENLANFIDEEFPKELDSLYRLAIEANSLRKSPKTLRDSFINANKYNFRQILWMKEDGSSSLRWQRDKISNDRSDNFKEREYFKAIDKEQYCYFSGDTSRKFSFEPVYSWLDGSYQGVLGIPVKSSDSLKIIAISNELKSVQNIVLPPELNYCIINEEGKVLFHSDENRNLNENILEECNNKTLNAAILARTNSEFHDYYMGKNSNFYIRPMSELPLFIITFSDTKYKGNIFLQISIFSFVHLLFIALVILAVLAIYVLFFKSKKRFTQQRIFSLEELYPLFRNAKKDTFLIGFNVIVFVISLLLSRYIYSSPALVVWLFLTNTICSFCLFIFPRVQNLDNHKKYILIAGIVFFFFLANLLVLQKPVGSGPHSTELIIGILLEQLVSIVFLISYLFFPKEKKEIGSKTNLQSKFYRKYTFMLITFFLLVGALPTFRLYQFFYHEEYILLLKYTQLQTAMRFQKRGALMPELQGQKYLSSYFDMQIEKVPRGAKPPKPPVSELVLFRSFLNNLRLLNSLRVASNSYYEDVSRLSSSDKRDPVISFYRDKTGQKLTLQYMCLCGIGKKNPSQIRLINNIPKYTFFPSQKTLFLFLISTGLLFLIIIYIFTLSFLKRLFHFEFFEGNVITDSKTRLEEILNARYKEKIPIRQIVIGTPRSGKNETIRNLLLDLNKEDFLSIDLTEIGDDDFSLEKYENGHQAKIVFLQHFDHDLTEEKLNRKKLDLLETLIRREKIHIVISTSIHPALFLESLRKQPLYGMEDYVYNNEYYNWAMVLSGFDLYTHPTLWPPRDVKIDDQETENYYLQQSLLLYFHALWGTFSKNEKFVLYDLAEDNIANYQNREAILSLYYKGIIVFDNDTRFIHQSLRDFILSEIDDEDIYLEREAIIQSSAWRKFRFPFILLIVAILFFVYYTQEETYNHIFALITVFIASIPGLISQLKANVPRAKENQPG